MISLEVHTVQRQLPCGKFSLFYMLHGLLKIVQVWAVEKLFSLPV